jgi:hypothetical protein
MVPALLFFLDIIHKRFGTGTLMSAIAALFGQKKSCLIKLLMRADRKKHPGKRLERVSEEKRGDGFEPATTCLEAKLPQAGTGNSWIGSIGRSRAFYCHASGLAISICRAKHISTRSYVYLMLASLYSFLRRTQGNLQE